MRSVGVPRRGGYNVAVTLRFLEGGDPWLSRASASPTRRCPRTTRAPSGLREGHRGREELARPAASLLCERRGSDGFGLQDGDLADRRNGDRGLRAGDAR